jgi:hypothetical protein
MTVSQAVLDELANGSPGIVVADGFRVYYGQVFSDTGVDVSTLLQTTPGIAGRIVQVPGASSASPMVTVRDANGNLTQEPWALRYSSTVDSDGDGIPNYIDSTPFDPVVLSSVSVINDTPELFSVSWRAAAKKTYNVEYSTTLKRDGWQLLKTVANTNNYPAVLQVRDPITSDKPSKTYRVVYTQ